MRAHDARGDDVYQPDGSEVTEDTGILDREDTLTGRASDPYDEGWSPPERPLGVDHVGTTAEEQHEGETLDERLAEELPDPAMLRAPHGDGIGDSSDSDGEALDDEVGAGRAGRLVAPDEGAHEEAEKDMLAEDVGIDGGAASAEEAAVHVVPDADGGLAHREQAGSPRR
ncbi:DUF5709 domain-containing protein [Streptomyces sp. NBC_01387]|uniref:DUF5709 domain-containing protein n=1 Tax=unclassified Streptomyces TaxID=2593676 RepID=UPI002024089A|nr:MULTISPECIES: DUF5709 domain-containing protein [unclassified Streptomyces]MCX4552663.1 DUF5709 domain-containing protein [Streptomyces sp. NBC_01500]WSC24854.1 DUF5709 domain-containing protein [Streptomyces sp. NBC_01766]WSV58839.1 DUF5709 domain-containing protein [Streptomyces sp. NBC_01014]